jgi:hypothetical protein
MKWQLSGLAEREDVVLLRENQKEVYGDVPRRPRLP